MWFGLVVVLVASCVQLSHGMQCLSQDGSPVDWFVVYKIPTLKDNKIPTIRNGTGFYYMDRNHPQLELSKTGMDETGHAVSNTLNQVYQNKTTMAYMMYNDQRPDGKTNEHGHTKGIVAFDKTRGFWMVHSTPQFPPLWKDGYKWPESGYKNGQTFLCISMAYSMMNNMGNVFMYTYPFFYDHYFPDVFVKDNPDLASIVNSPFGRQKHVKSPPWNEVTKLTTAGGDTFMSLGKFTNFGRDLYDGLVAPELRVDLLVQSWIESEKTKGDKLPSNCSVQYKVYNIDSMQFPGADGVTFKTSKDHSKWAISKEKGNWLCIGDINRQKPQFHRGGGQVCFQNPNAWKSFSGLVKETEPCPKMKT